MIPGDKLKVHLTVDTGMGRGGFLPNDLLQLQDELNKLTHLDIEGIGSHLPCADEDEAFTRAQFEQFDTLIEEARGRQISLYPSGEQRRHFRLSKPPHKSPASGIDALWHLSSRYPSE